MARDGTRRSDQSCKGARAACVLEPVEVAALPGHSLRTMNGRGALENQQIVDYVSFQTEWLQRALNVDLRNLALVEVIGDSMSPTIDEGDLVLVDLREARFRHDGVYVLRTGSDLAVKRLQRQPDGELLIRSDNPAYESSTVKPDDVALLGRVVWIGGRP